MRADEPTLFQGLLRRRIEFELLTNPTVENPQSSQDEAPKPAEADSAPAQDAPAPADESSAAGTSEQRTNAGSGQAR